MVIADEEDEAGNADEDAEEKKTLGIDFVRDARYYMRQMAGRQERSTRICSRLGKKERASAFWYHRYDDRCKAMEESTSFLDLDSPPNLAIS